MCVLLHGMCFNIKFLTGKQKERNKLKYVYLESLGKLVELRYFCRSGKLAEYCILLTYYFRYLMFF